jgi:spore cortex formation protein SpoVR/YcgB (stage V sporulation)
MSINTLNTLKEKNNEDFVKSFLSKSVVITEKLDTYRILFQKKNNSINFYKKDNKSIDIIERTLSDI